MLFAFVSEGWTAREGYWRNTFYSSDYQRRFPLTLCIAIICNSYNGKYCCLYCKGLGFFVTDVNLYPFSLQSHQGLWLNQVKGWTWNTTLNHHTRQNDELVQNYVARLDLHKKSPIGAAVTWHMPGLIRHYCSSKGSVSVVPLLISWKQDSQEAQLQKTNSPISTKMELWPKASLAWVFMLFR